MFGNCLLGNYLLFILIILSNTLTIYYIFPILPDFLTYYEKFLFEEIGIYFKGLYIGVKYFI
jgi:hypothetical protein